MNDDEFWTLIDRSRGGTAGDPDAQAERLGELLTELSVEQLVAFDRRFVQANLALYTWAMWGAATVVLGWCSDDVFTDFRSWVVSLGRQTYDRVVADPEVLAEVQLADPEEIGAGELFAFAAGEAYQEATGRDLWDAEPERQTPESPDGEPGGQRFAETDEELRRRYPRLAARWMAPGGAVLPGQLPR
jgi:hypothetical protein